MKDFKAFRIHEREGKIAAGFERMGIDALTEGDVVIRVQYSSINFKDALAATGAGKILRKYPLNGGIDLSGEVVSSTDARYQAGQKVLVTGCGHSETLDGGYAEYVRSKGDFVIPLPDGMSLFDAMGLGTAGFTAALALHRMEQNGQVPAKGPIVVTGATAAGFDMTAARVTAITVAFLGSAALWWLYFDYVARIAQLRLGRADDRGRLARDAGAAARERPPRGARAPRPAPLVLAPTAGPPPGDRLQDKSRAQRSVATSSLWRRDARTSSPGRDPCSRRPERKWPAPR